MFRSLLLVALFALRALSQEDDPTTVSTVVESAVTTSPSVTSPTTANTSTGTRTTRVPRTRTTQPSAFDPSAPPDVHLNVPELSVDRIELVVEKLSADINLNAKVAQLVTLNAGVQVSVEKINITIADVDVNLELQVRLGHLVDIVNRVFESLDLNPLLINAINGITDIVGEVVGAVDGLLGSITQGGTTLNFLVDNLGHIVQEVIGADGPVSTIVGDYSKNMTFTGTEKSLGNGLVQKTYAYEPLNALVDIVFNTAGQVVQAVVQKKNGGGGGNGGGSTTRTSTTVTGTTTPIPTPSTTTAPAETPTTTEAAEETSEPEPELEAKKKKKKRNGNPGGPGGPGKKPKNH